MLRNLKLESGAMHDEKPIWIERSERTVRKPRQGSERAKSPEEPIGWERSHFM